MLGPLYVYGIATILFLEIAVNVLPHLFGIGPLTVFGLQMAALAGVPLAFGLGVLRGGFARSGEIEELGVWLGSADAGRRGPQEALAATLGDHSLEPCSGSANMGTPPPMEGRPKLPRLGSSRAAVEVELAGRRIGAITYDAELIAAPDLVRAAGRVIALALERERLTAELLASRASLRESRDRIVQAGDQERRRIARDLHDGFQGRLVALAIQAGRIGTDPAARAVQPQLTELRTELQRATDELRALVQGVMPALLLERGLYAATEDLVDRMPLPTTLELDGTTASAPLPQTVESTSYFVVAEALTNAIKHSQARELAVTLARDDGTLRIEVADDGVGGATAESGYGLRGIADRLDVLGGRFARRKPGRWRHAASGGGSLRVVIGEDEVLLREGLLLVLLEAGIDVVGVAGEADELLRLALERQPEVVIADIRMPPGQTDDGLRAALQIRVHLPETAVVILSQHVNRQYARQLMDHGTAGLGYLLKQRVADVDGFIRTLRRVAAGHRARSRCRERDAGASTP